MKKYTFLSFFAILLMAFVLAGCGSATSEDTSGENAVSPTLVSILARESDTAGETQAAADTAKDSPAGTDASAPATAAENTAEVNTAAPAVQSSVPLGDLEKTLIDLYENVNPSVVHIFVFDQDFPLGTGSGFVFDEAGYIVTNNHVVENGNRFEVVFPNGERREATVAGKDVDSDLAVIQVEDLPAEARPLPLGDSSALHVGQFVIAIGNPFGQESSMSLGIVSGVGRSLASQRIAEGGGRYSLPQVIQTDAPINPGNSGGPLLNLSGEVVGVNAAIRSETGANSGVGFSIPVNAVRRIAPELIKSGKYVYPFLGVSINDGIDLARQETLGLNQGNGAYVITVSPDGPAGKAGLRGASGENQAGGDLIIAIDGQPVTQFEDLITYLVFETEVGQTVELTVVRDGEQMVIPVVLGARP